jgi:SHS2 domain-containing protein
MLEHMSDAYIEAYGRDLNEAYANAAYALTDTVIDIQTVKPELKKVIEVRGFDLLNLLYNWLETILLEMQVEQNVFREFSTKVSKEGDSWVIRAECFGERFDLEKHRPKVEVKAVTYHLMEVIDEGNRYVLRFLLDL